MNECSLVGATYFQSKSKTLCSLFGCLEVWKFRGNYEKQSKQSKAVLRKLPMMKKEYLRKLPMMKKEYINMIRFISEEGRLEGETLAGNER